MNRKRRIDAPRLVVGLIIFALCMVGFFSNSGKDADTLPRAQFNNSTPLGGKGLRLMLERLGYKVYRQKDALAKMPADAKIWLLLDPETRFTKGEADRLLAWVRQGGTLVFCVKPNSDGLFGIANEPQSEGVEALHVALNASASEGRTPSNGEFLPGLSPLYLDTVSNYRAGIKKATGSARTLKVSRSHLDVAGAPGGSLIRVDVGQGRVFLLPDALLVTNYGLSKDNNAVLVTNLLRAHAPSGSVYFDERSSGEDAVRTEHPTLITYLKRAPVVYAVWQVIIAGLMFWAFAGRRLGAPVSLPGAGPVTRASHYAAAMGALFSKTNRPQAASRLIGIRFRRRLAQRLGLSPAEADAVLAKRAQEISGIPYEVTDRLLLQSRAPATTLSEALRDAQEMEMVLRRLEGRA